MREALFLFLFDSIFFVLGRVPPPILYARRALFVTVDRSFCFGSSAAVPFCTCEVPCLLPQTAFIVSGRLPSIFCPARGAVFHGGRQRAAAAAAAPGPKTLRMHTPRR